MPQGSAPRWGSSSLHLEALVRRLRVKQNRMNREPSIARRRRERGCAQNERCKFFAVRLTGQGSIKRACYAKLKLFYANPYWSLASLMAWEMRGAFDSSVSTQRLRMGLAD